LAKKGIVVELAIIFQTFSKAEQDWLEKLAQNNVHVVRLAKWKKNLRIVEFIKACYKLISYQKSQKFNIIHSHTQYGTLAAIYTKLIDRQVKVVRTAHVTKEWGNTIFGRIQRFIGNLIFPLTVDAQVAVSNAVLKNINKYIGQKCSPKEPFLIYNAISIPRQKIKYTNNKCEFVVGTSARLTEQKGINYLIEAASIVCQQIPNVKFLIAGDGELREKLQKQINQMGLSNCVFLIGKYLDVYEFFSQLDLFVLPSLWEGLPTVILESMAYGVPVIATNIPGTNELIQDNLDGWLVSPKNSGELAEKIIFTLREPLLRELIKKEGFKKAEQFSIDKIADQYINLFQQLLF